MQKYIPKKLSQVLDYPEPKRRFPLTRTVKTPEGLVWLGKGNRLFTDFKAQWNLQDHALRTLVYYQGEILGLTYDGQVLNKDGKVFREDLPSVEWMKSANDEIVFLQSDGYWFVSNSKHDYLGIKVLDRSPAMGLTPWITQEGLLRLSWSESSVPPLEKDWANVLEDKNGVRVLLAQSSHKTIYKQCRRSSHISNGCWVLGIADKSISVIKLEKDLETFQVKDADVVNYDLDSPILDAQFFPDSSNFIVLEEKGNVWIVVSKELDKPKSHRIIFDQGIPTSIACISNDEFAIQMSSLNILKGKVVIDNEGEITTSQL